MREHPNLSRSGRPDVINVGNIWWGEGTRDGSFVPIFRHKGIDHQLFAVYMYGRLETFFQHYHANFQHIISNTIPLFVLLILLAGSRAESWEVVIFIEKERLAL